LQKILGNESIQEQAKSSGFCSRKSKLTPEIFFDLMFYSANLSHNCSLESLVAHLASMHGIDIRKQSLDERFTEKTVNFVKSVLIHLIESQFSDVLFSEDLCSDYNHVRIKDSTVFKVPDNLSDHYKGNGGSLSAIKIQYEYDLKTGKLLDMTITAANRNDLSDASETVENVCENDLIIRDLGYFSSIVFEKIIKKNAFFLSRLHTSVAVYDENNIRVDFQKLYDFMTKNGIEEMEKIVFMGKNKFPVRLFIKLAPPKVYEERIRKREKEAKKRGQKTKENTKCMYHFNLFITNIKSSKLPANKIMPLYRLRWQVELMFKNWKSVFSIHTLQKMKEERYLTILYMRLIEIVIDLQIINRLQSLLSKQKQNDIVLSYRKTLQTLKNRCLDILCIIRLSSEKATGILSNIYQNLSKNHCREKRKNKENFIEIINLFICESKNNN
jgi:hypothetical protein